MFELEWLWDANGFLSVRPFRRSLSEYVFQTRIQIDRQKDTILVLTRLGSAAAAPSPVWTSELEYAVPVLKSNLQKAVRRGLYHVAKATAKQLLTQDAVAFLRRLPIIAVEDVCYLGWIPHVIWLMAAVSKGYVLSEDEQIGLVHLVGQLSVYNEARLCDKRPVNSDDDSNNQASFWAPPHHNVAIAFGLRIAYGGSRGDLELLRRHGLYVLDNNESRSFSSWVQEACSKTSSEIVEFAPVHKLVQAVDFHCTPSILKEIRSFVPRKELRRAIWFYRSSPNFRILDYPQSGKTVYGALDSIPPVYIQEKVWEPVWWKQVHRQLDAASWKYWKGQTTVCSNKRDKEQTTLDQFLCDEVRTKTMRRQFFSNCSTSYSSK